MNCQQSYSNNFDHCPVYEGTQIVGYSYSEPCMILNCEEDKTRKVLPYLLEQLDSIRIPKFNMTLETENVKVALTGVDVGLISAVAVLGCVLLVMCGLVCFCCYRWGPKTVLKTVMKCKCRGTVPNVVAVPEVVSPPVVCPLRRALEQWGTSGNVSNTTPVVGLLTNNPLREALNAWNDTPDHQVVEISEIDENVHNHQIDDVQVSDDQIISEFDNEFEDQVLIDLNSDRGSVHFHQYENANVSSVSV